MIGKPCMLVLTKLHCPPSLCEHMVNQLHGTKQKSLPQRVVGSPVINLVLLFFCLHYYPLLQLRCYKNWDQSDSVLSGRIAVQSSAALKSKSQTKRMRVLK